MSPGSTTTPSAAMISCERRQVDAAATSSPRWWREVDEHAAALHAVERHVLQAEVVGEASGGRCRRRGRRRDGPTRSTPAR